MPTQILVNGFSGQIGQIALKAIQEDDALNLTGRTRRGDDLTKAIGDAQSDVVLDLTAASVVFDNAKTGRGVDGIALWA